MERWAGRVAVVTGANSGVGAAIAEILTKKGCYVVGIATHVENIKALVKSLKRYKGKLYPMKADLTDENEIKATFNWIKSKLGGVDILVNNAGANTYNTLVDGPVEVWKKIMELNVIVLSYCTREAIQSMTERKVAGHIVHINSVAGHHVLDIPGLAMYTASKHAVTALTEALRRELVSNNSKIRVTSISPGTLKTEMAPVKYPALEPNEIADAVVYALSVPPHVQIQEITIRAVGELK